MYIKSVKDKYYLNFEEINDVKERYIYLLKLFWIPKANIPSQAVGNKLELYIVKHLWRVLISSIEGRETAMKTVDTF